MKPAVGLGSARFCVSGAAPIAKEVIEFFARLDVIVLEVYGQSEDTGPTSFNLPHRFRFGTVGPALEGRRLLDAGLPQGALVALVERDGAQIVPQGGTVLRGGDVALVVVQEGQEAAVRGALEGPPVG